MNPLSWLPFYNEEKLETETFDGSLLVPLTVGLVSVVSSVLVGYRSGLLSRKQAASLIVKHVEQAERPNSSASREMTKRKSASKTSVKPTSAAANPVLTPASTFTEPLVETVPPPKPVSKMVDHSKQYTVQTVSVKQDQTPSSSPKLPSHSTGNSAQLPIVASKSNTSSGKKNKKPKQSHARPDSEASVAQFNATESDMAWVVVTSKKMKHSTAATTPNGQPNSKGMKKKPKSHEDSDDKLTTSTQPSTPKPAIDGARSSVGDEKKPSVKLNDSENITQLPNFVPKSPTSRCIPEQDITHPSTIPLVATTSTGHRIDEAKMPNTFDLPVSQSLTMHYAIANSVPVISHLPTSHTSKLMTAATPATVDLLTQHLSAQVNAKELECQLLRDEVIRLREEVNTLKLGPPTRSASCVNAETMTDVPETPTKPTTSPEPSTAPSTENSSIPQPSDSPDSILLITLQQEIARLAREMTLSQQRNENMEARLATANKQISTAKSESAKQLKAIHHELDLQTQRAQQSEEAQRRLEAELGEALQQLECTRRKAEQWERERAILVNERDQLARERDTLASEHKACLSELENTRRTSEELQASIREAELRAQSLERDRSVVLGESHARIAQLEAQLAASHEQEQTERSRLQAAESTIAQMRADVEQFRCQLIAKDQELESFREKCDTLDQKISEITERRQFSDGNEALAVETIQSVSDTKPIAAAAHSLVETSTQTDPEPGAEFEPEATTISASTAVPAENSRGCELEIGKLNVVAISPKTEDADESANEDLEAQVAHYKSALAMTESILSKLQSSVNEEEERWRKALDVSRMECEVLEERLNKLESSLAVVTEERDSLAKRLDETLNEPNTHADRISVGNRSMDDDRSSVQSLTVARMLDNVRFDEATPKPELIRLLNKFRYLIQVEHEALKKEQIISSQLQSQLEAVQRRSSRQSSISEVALNGLPSTSPAVSDSAFVNPDVCSTLDVVSSGQENHTSDRVSSNDLLSDTAVKSTDHQSDLHSSTVMTNGLHPNDSVDGSP